MRLWLCILLILGMLASCAHRDDSAQIAAQFTPYLQGSWVKSDYIAAVEKTRSPFKAYDKLGGVVSLLIDTRDVSADSLQAGFSLNDHEGTEFYLYFRKGLLPNSLPVNLKDYENPANFYEIGYAKHATDTALILYHISKEKTLLDSVQYTRVHHYVNTDGDVGEGVAWIVSKLLFAGDYTRYDSTGEKGRLHFSDGKVTGFNEFTNYMVVTDFLGPDQHDLLGLGNGNRADSVFYGWELRNDSILLYSTREGRDQELINDKLKYVLKH